MNLCSHYRFAKCDYNLSHRLALSVLSMDLGAYRTRTKEFIQTFMTRMQDLEDKIGSCKYTLSSIACVITVDQTRVTTSLSDRLRFRDALDMVIKAFKNNFDKAMKTLKGKLSEIEKIYYTRDECMYEVSDIMDAFDAFLESDEMDIKAWRQDYMDNMSEIANKIKMSGDPERFSVLVTYESCMNELIEVLQWTEDFSSKMSEFVYRYIR